MNTIKGSTTHRPQSNRGHTRPLYIKAVPEAVWLRVHDNANRSRMRLKDYVTAVLLSCEPLQSLSEVHVMSPATAAEADTNKSTAIS